MLSSQLWDLNLKLVQKSYNVLLPLDLLANLRHVNLTEECHCADEQTLQALLWNIAIQMH